MNSISIIGGGIGGLTLGNFLKQHNIDFKIYESAPEIKAVGAGIAMAGNAGAFNDTGVLIHKTANSPYALFSLMSLFSKLICRVLAASSALILFLLMNMLMVCMVFSHYILNG